MAVLKTERDEIYVILITEHVVRELETFLKDIRETIKKNIPMYALVKDNVNWSAFKKIDGFECWRKVYFYEDDKDVERAWKRIELDVKLYYSVVKI